MKSSYPKTFTLLAVASAVAMTLSACGGGSTNEAGGTASGLLSNSVSAGAKAVTAGQATAISAYAIIRGAAPSSMAWSVAPLGTVNSGDPAPVISDANCSTATLTPPVVAGTSGEGSCNTSIYFPPNSKAGTWRVKNTAASTTAGSVSNYIDITVAPAALGGFRLVESSAALTGMVGRSISMSTPFTIDSGARAANIKYSWVAEAGNPAVVPIAGASTSSASFTPTIAGQYAFKVTATADVNGFTQTSTATVVAVVQAASSADELSLGGVTQAAAGENVFLNGSVVKIEPTATYTYKWEQLDGVAGGPERITLSGANSASASFVAPRTAGNYTFKFTTVRTNANGTQQISFDQKTVVIRQSVDAVFTALAGDVQIEDANKVIFLKGSVASQNTSSNYTYQYNWRQKGGPSIVNISNANSNNASFLPQVAGTYDFELEITATTPNGTSYATSQTQVIVRNATATPITTFAISANAGPAQSVDVNRITNLIGSQFTQGTASGVIYSYEWSQISNDDPNTPRITINNNNSATASFIPTRRGTYSFQLIVTAKLPDGTEKSTTATTTVVAGQLPADMGTFTLSAGNAQSIIVQDPATLNSQIATTGNLDGAVFTYQWLATDSTIAISNANSPTASFVTQTPGVYTFRLTVNATRDGVTITKTAETQVLVKPIGLVF